MDNVRHTISRFTRPAFAAFFCVVVLIVAVWAVINGSIAGYLVAVGTGLWSFGVLYGLRYEIQRFRTVWWIVLTGMLIFWVGYFGQILIG